MASESIAVRPVPDGNSSIRTGLLARLSQRWFLVLSALILVGPTFYALSQGYWQTEQGGHGPVILATGLWLLWHEGQHLEPGRNVGRSSPVIAAILFFGALSVVGGIASERFVQTASTYACFVALLYYGVGLRGLRRIWAPVIYLAFLIPPPDRIMAPLTAFLKVELAHWAVNLLSAFGIPAAADGANLYIGPYQLVVEAACAGMNSLVSLLAIGLFYTYLLYRSNWQYALILSLFIVPIAILANYFRILLLLLLTYYGGAAAGQGLAHDAMGLSTFVIALLCLVALDKLLAPLLSRRWSKERA